MELMSLSVIKCWECSLLYIFLVIFSKMCSVLSQDNILTANILGKIVNRRIF